jgi:hypothetical protein
MWVVDAEICASLAKDDLHGKRRDAGIQLI